MQALSAKLQALSAKLQALSAKLQGGSLVSNPFTPAARQCLSGAVATWQIEAWHLAIVTWHLANWKFQEGSLAIFLFSWQLASASRHPIPSSPVSVSRVPHFYPHRTFLPHFSGFSFTFLFSQCSCTVHTLGSSSNAGLLHKSAFCAQKLRLARPRNVGALQHVL